MIETQIQMQPPRNNNGGSVATASDFPDDIVELGDQIAALSRQEAKQLLDYLADKGIKPLLRAIDILPGGYF